MKSEQKAPTATNPTRRKILRAAALALPGATILSRAGSAFSADKTLVIRTTAGGSYGDAMEKAIFAPFTRATGITVQKTPADMAPLIASVKQGRPIVDIVDTSEGLLQTLGKAGVLAPIDYARFRSFAIADIGKDAAQERIVRRMMLARVMGYKKSKFPKGAPHTWADFWDVQKFPASRALSGLGLNYPDLEFGLLAAGTSPSNVYPIDTGKALQSFSRIRPHIDNFYGTDAISQSLLSSGEVELEAIANGRIQPMIDAGGDYAIEWNQHMKTPSGYAILQNTRNLDNAYRFLDFAMSPEVQAHFSTLIPYGPINHRAFQHIPEQLAAKLPTNPRWTDTGFTQNAQWWGDNLPAVTKAWNEWAA